MGAATAIVVGAILGAAAGYGAHEQRSARKDAEEAANKQALESEQLRMDMDRRTKEEQDRQAALQRESDTKSQAVSSRDALRRRQGALARGGRRETILTSPLGDPGQAQTTQKTLLGA